MLANLLSFREAPFKNRITQIKSHKDIEAFLTTQKTKGDNESKKQCELTCQCDNAQT